MKILDQLKEYINNRTPSQIEDDDKLLDKWNNIGPTVEEYFKSLNIMTIKELKQILNKYSDDALVGISIKTELKTSFSLKEESFYNNLILVAE